MYRKTSVFIEIFKLYEVGKYDPAYNWARSDPEAVEQNLQTMRKAIRAMLRKSFPQYDWSDTNNWFELSEYERERFKYDTVFEYMESHPGTTFKEVKYRIIEYVNNDLQELKEQDYYENLEKQFFNPADSEEKQKKAYDKLCSILSGFLYVLPPSFDEWRAAPKTPIEYVQSVDLDEWDVDTTEFELDPNDSEIDHYLLHALLKLLKKTYGIEIDIEAIKKDLKTRKEEMRERAYTETEAQLLQPELVKPFRITDKENIDFLRARSRLNRFDYIGKKGRIVIKEEQNK